MDVLAHGGRLSPARRSMSTYVPNVRGTRRVASRSPSHGVTMAENESRPQTPALALRESSSAVCRHWYEPRNA